jgi:hypothetical protein
MSILLRLLCFILICGFLAASAATAGGQFYVHEPARNAVKTVALLPMRVDPATFDSIQDAQKVVGRIEDGVLRRLRDAGYSVVEPARFKDFWDVEQPKAGPLYHPFTGEMNVDTHKTVRANAQRRLSETYPHDATVDLSFITHFADMRDGTIEWDDVVESAAGYSALADLLLGPGRNNEMLQVLSLQVVLRDRNGDPMYMGNGGLQPLQKSPFWGSFYDAKPVPLFNDPKREARAMDMALGAWLMNPKAFKQARSRARSKLPVPQAAKPAPRSRPFDRAAFVATNPTIAVAPVVLSDFKGNRGAVRARYNQLMVDWLLVMGYRVISASEFLKAWDHAISGSMGVYDEITGRAIPGARDELMKHVMDELREKHGVDALVTSSISRRMVSFSNGYGNWDGLEWESVPGSKLGNENRLREYFGVVPAISLNVALLDAEGHRMAGGAGGIQFIQRFTQGQFVDIDERDWFKDPEVNSQAVWLALRPLDMSEKEKKAADKAAAGKAGE